MQNVDAQCGGHCYRRANDVTTVAVSFFSKNRTKLLARPNGNKSTWENSSLYFTEQYHVRMHPEYLS
jgi:hypothetical protein